MNGQSGLERGASPFVSHKVLVRNVSWRGNLGSWQLLPEVIIINVFQDAPLPS